LELNLPNNVKFYKVLTVKDIFMIFGRYPQKSYIIYGGNTAHGILKIYFILSNQLLLPTDNYKLFTFSIIKYISTNLGVFRQKNVDVYIDINDVEELKNIENDRSTLTMGANLTLSKAKACCEKYMNDRGFRHLKRIAKHIDYVGSIPIQNVYIKLIV
jgi:hypothetical protein